MIRNKAYRKWYAKINPNKYYDKLWDEIESEFKEFLKTNPSKEEIYSEQVDRDYNLHVCWDEQNIYLSDKLIRKAQRLGIPLPSPRPSPGTEGSVENDWAQSVYFTYYLKEKARYNLMLKIREEQKWRRERISFFSNIIIAFLGLVVAILSLLYSYIIKICI
jgi:hypothetical protein